MSGFSDIKKLYTDTIKADKLKYESPNLQLSDRKPVLVEAFYNIEGTTSSTTIGFDSIPKYIGSDAPTRYNKIVDVVMFGWSAQEREKSDDPNIGFAYKQVGQSLIMGDTFVPLPGSFFRVSMDNQYFLYQVTDVTEILDKDRPMYQITHEKYADNSEERYSLIESQVVANFKYIADYVGVPDKKVVIPIDKYNNLVNITNIIKDLQIQYMRAFYDTKLTHTMVCRKLVNNIEEYFYSPFVIEFIKETMCLYDDVKNMNIVLSHETIADIKFKMIYESSIYKKIMNETYSIDDTGIVNFIIDRYDNSAFFSHFNRVPNKTINIIDHDNLFDLKVNSGDYNMYILDLKVNSSALDMAIDSFMNISLKVSDLKGYKINPYSIDDYMKIPIVIYLLKRYGMGDLVKKPYSDSIMDILNI